MFRHTPQNGLPMNRSSAFVTSLMISGLLALWAAGANSQPATTQEGGAALPPTKVSTNQMAAMTWKGRCSMPPLKTDYPLSLVIEKQEGSNIVGQIHHPDTHDSKTKFKGTLTADRATFSEYELIQGKGVYLPTDYAADIKGDKMEGTWKTRIMFIPVTGRFALERQPASDVKQTPPAPPKAR